MPSAPRARSRTPASARTTSTAISAPPATRRGSAPLSMVDYHGPEAAAHAIRPIPAARPTCCRSGMPPRRSRSANATIALITLAGRPRAEGMATGTAPRAPRRADARTRRSRSPTRPATANMYAMCAMRHMHQYGTTSEQLAWVKVAASHHAQHNPHAMLRDVVTVEDVVNSPMIADPLHRLDCCVISDGGGAIIVASPEIAKSLKRPLGQGHRRRRGAEAPDGRQGRSDLFRRGVVGAAAPSPRPGSSRPTSNTPRSTTASRSPC